MKKLLLSAVSAFLCLSSVFALDLPSGYTSINDLVFETERCPLVVPAKTSFQFAGVSLGWGQALTYDLSAYKQLVYNLSFDAAAGGTQVAIRFAINGAAKDPVIFTLPTGVTTCSISIPLEKHKDANGAILLGGSYFYNGAPGNTVVYTAGLECVTDVTVNYVALTTQAPTALSTVMADNPDAMVNVYNLTGILVRKAVKQSEATRGLNTGLYLVNGRKVFVTK